MLFAAAWLLYDLMNCVCIHSSREHYPGCDERAKYDRTRQRPIIAFQFELATHDPPPAFS
jgi:hypothetical protein